MFAGLIMTWQAVKWRWADFSNITGNIIYSSLAGMLTWSIREGLVHFWGIILWWVLECKRNAEVSSARLFGSTPPASDETRKSVCRAGRYCPHSHADVNELKSLIDLRHVYFRYLTFKKNSFIPTFTKQSGRWQTISIVTHWISASPIFNVILPILQRLSCSYKEKHTFVAMRISVIWLLCICRWTLNRGTAPVVKI